MLDKMTTMNYVEKDIVKWQRSRQTVLMSEVECGAELAHSFGVSIEHMNLALSYLLCE
jgi:hypothetical protein